MKRGRARLDGDEPATTVIRVRVTAGQRLKLTRVADENGTSLSGVLREAVNTYCDDYLEQPSGRVFRRTSAGRVPHTSDMANPTPQPPNPQQPRPPQPPTPSGPSQPPNTPDTGTHLPKT